MNANHTANRILLFIFSLTLSLAAVGQTMQPQHAGEIKQAIKRLNVLGSVLYFAAHPDDENTRLIAWLAKEKQYRTGYLSLTRGDGGQNLIGTEQAEELGLIRTNELLAARRVDGGEQFFSRAVDFGFSKTWDETFRIWGRDDILADAVWVIRKFRPDVIITRFPPDERAGHGHHQASALLAIEAFKAAADPNRFPEQLTEVEIWQPKRLLWNTGGFFQGSTAGSTQFLVNIGDYNPYLGLSYGEIAADSRSNHKSQGFGSARQRGDVVERFELLQGDLPREHLFDGVETSWKRVAGGEHMAQLIDAIDRDFDMTHPERSVGSLLTLFDELTKLPDSYWKSRKIEEVSDLILACGGIWFESYAPAPKYALGERIPVTTAFIVRRPGLNVTVNGTALPFNEVQTIHDTYATDRTTQPYWLRQVHGLGRFNVTDRQEIGRPGNADLPKRLITLQINGRTLTFERPIVYKYTHPVRGEVYQPLVVAPRITANLGQKALVFNGDQPKSLEVTFTAHAAGRTMATASLRLPSGWRAEPQQVALDFGDRDDEQQAIFTIYPAQTAALSDSVAVVIHENGRAGAASAFREIAYDHIPHIAWFPPASARLSKIETGVSAQRIGYLPGAGDLIPQALREIGLQVDMLSEQDVLSGNLSQYDAIVTGVRLYNVNERIRQLQPRLLAYVENGGTLVVQYNVNGGLKTNNLGPYPLTLTRNRVTDEAAPVTIVDPESRIMTYPNRITAADFEGWIQERGLYFVGEADSRYERPLRMADPGESALDGSLLVARYGKGNFVYTSLAFFRQLPVGVPGAYRLFVNLLAKPN